MRKTKCIGLAVLVVFLSVLMAVGAVSAAAEEGTATITVDTSALGEVTAGSTVTVPVYLEFDTARDLGAFKLDVLIDGEYMTVDVPKAKYQPSVMTDDYEGTYTNSGNKSSWYCIYPVSISEKTHILNINVTISSSEKRTNNQVYVNLTNLKFSGIMGTAITDGYTIDLHDGIITVTYPPSKPDSVSITAPTGSLPYKATGTAVAVVKDQYGEVISSPSLVWQSSNTNALIIDSTTGEYEVISCGVDSVDITATADEAEDTQSVSLTKATPASSDFDITVPTGVIYDGQPHAAVTAVVKSGIYGMGDVTVLYNGKEDAPVNAGSYPITLNVTAGDNYTAAPAVATGETFVILKADPVKENLTYSLTAVDYDGTAKSVSVAAKPGVTGLGDITVKYNGNTAAPVAAGDYTVSVEIAEGDNYNATAAPLELGKFTINKKEPQEDDITLDPEFTEGKYSIEYGSAFSGFTVSSDTIAQSSLSVKYNGTTTPVPTAKGTYVINVSVSGDLNYTDKEFTVGTFIITGKLIPKPALTGYEYVYNGTVITAAIPVNSNYTISGQTAAAVGTYTATVSLNDKDNTAWSTGETDDLSIVWNITNATMTDVSVQQNGELTYNGTAQTAAVIAEATTVDETTPSFTYSTEEAGTYGADVPAFTAADDYTVYYIASAANHSDAKGSFTVTIVQKDISDAAVNLGGYTFVYNVTPQTVPIVNVTVSAGWLLETSDYEVSGNVTEAAAGEYVLTVTGIGNYTGSASAEWNITAKDLSAAALTLNKTSVVYNTLVQNAGVESVVLEAPYGTLSAADYAVSGDVAKTAVGEYAVTVTGIGNYTGSVSKGWNITKAAPTKEDFDYTIVAQIEYDGQPHAVTVTSANITDGTITVTYNGSVSAPAERGTYLVNVSVSGATNYIDASDINLGQFEIIIATPKASDFIYTAPSNLIYDGTAKEASVTTENPELQGNFTVKYYQDNVETTPVNIGHYDVVAETQATENYNAANVTVGSFIIISKRSSGGSSGSSVWLTATSTPVPTAAPTAEPTWGAPTAQPVTSTTPAPATPAPFVGILAGLAAAAAAAVLRRK